MLWFLDENGDAWPGTVGPLTTEWKRTDLNLDLWTVRLGTAALLSTHKADEAAAVHAALLEIIARYDSGLVECRVRTGGRGRREALAWLRGNSTTTCAVEVAPDGPSGGDSETTTSGGDAC